MLTQENKKMAVWVALAIAIVLGLLWQFFPIPDAQARMNQLPLLGNKYLGRNVPLSDFEKEFFANVGLLKRLYQVDNQHLFITALDGTRNRHKVHDPFYCFRGGGWELDSEERVKLPHGDAMFLNLKKGDQTQQAMYWFTDGTHQYASPFRYWVEATLRRLTFGLSGNEPILIVVQPVASKTLDWQAMFQEFPELLSI